MEKIYEEADCEIRDNKVITYAGGEYMVSDTIVKHSKNLIDLIEVGDYINGFLVLDIDTVLKTGEGKALDIEYGNYIFDDEVKTILTKERYMANCYKVGGEE